MGPGFCLRRCRHALGYGLRFAGVGAVALLLAGPLVAQHPTGSPADDDLTATIRALGTDSLAAGITVYFSPGYRDRGTELGRLLDAALDFFGDSLDVHVDFRAAVLDRSAWERITSLPYGLPYVSSRGGRSVTVLPADGGGVVYEAYSGWEPRLPAELRQRVAGTASDWDALARRMVDLIGLHEVGHAVARAADVWPPQKWLDEMVASYLAVSFLRARRPAELEVWTLMTDAGLAVHRPRHHSLEDFERLYTAVGALDYIWYQSAFAQRARTLAEDHGLDFLRELRTRPGRVADGSVPPLLSHLDTLAPGFRDWADIFGDRDGADRHR